MLATITTPRILVIGGGAVNETANVAKKLAVAKPLIVTDPFMVKCGILAKVQASLDSGGIAHELFDATVPDPTTDGVEAGLAKLKAAGCDSVIGLGGGSPMDTAKAIAVLATNGGRMRDYMGLHKVPKAGLPIIAIPTTAGTGSEVTKVTVITDSANSEKMMCLDVAFLPQGALVDYELTFGMPMRLTADTGLDSLTHAIEAFVSKKRNPYTDTIALSAMGLIARNIRTACREPQNAAAREAMMLGATQGGIAFSNASVCLVHGMSRPIGAFFHVPHGLSNAMLLPTVTEFSAPAAADRYAECARAIGAADRDTPDDRAVAALLAELRSLNVDLEVPSPKAYGIDRAKFAGLMPTMAQQALASGSPANNPRVPTADEIVALYEKAWD